MRDSTFGAAGGGGVDGIEIFIGSRCGKRTVRGAEEDRSSDGGSQSSGGGTRDVSQSCADRIASLGM